MEKQNKILIGLGIAVVGYLLLKPKASIDKPVPVNKLTTNIIDAQTNTISTSTTTETTTKAIVEKITKKPVSTTTQDTQCDGQMVTLQNGTTQCVQAYIITDQERLQNSFTPKDFKNELSTDAFGNLNSLMTMGNDWTWLDGWAGGGTGGPSGMKGGPSDYLWTSTGTISS